MAISVPTAYTDEELVAFMHQVLGAVATDLGFTTTPDLGSYREAVLDVLVAGGVSATSEVTNIPLVRALAKVAAWQLALTAAATLYDVADGTQSLKRSQMLAGIKEALAKAQDEAGPLLVAAGVTDYAVTVLRVNRTDDPYISIPDEERVP